MTNNNKNVLFNVSNVLHAISDTDFILNNWKENVTPSNIITSCREAIQILDDYSFFDVLKPDLGFWKEILAEMPSALINNIVEFARQLDAFTGYDKDGNELIQDSGWQNIMFQANKLYTEMIMQF